MQLDVPQNSTEGLLPKPHFPEGKGMLPLHHGQLISNCPGALPFHTGPRSHSKVGVLS